MDSQVGLNTIQSSVMFTRTCKKCTENKLVARLIKKIKRKFKNIKNLRWKM